MKTVSLGKSGVDVSIYSLGAMYFGSRNDRATSYRVQGYLPQADDD